MKDIIEEMRIQHWIKNLLVFLPLACSGCFFEKNLFFRALVGFVSFGCIASSIYIINDIFDIEKDRMHPVKSKRPIAAGRITTRDAKVVLLALLVLAVLLEVYLANPYSSGMLILYWFLNVFYSKGGKNVPILDVTLLVSGFLIRVLYGSSITHIVISNWLYLTILSISFYLALGKRRNEKRKSVQQQSEGLTREVLKYYPEGFLDRYMYMFLALTNVFYALWSMDNKRFLRGINLLVWTVPLVIIITMKYSMDIEFESWGDPVDVVLNDKILIFLCFIYVCVMFFILYVV